MRNDSVNRYEGCVEQWKINLISARLKAFRIPQDHWPDLTQNLAVSLMRFQYSPEHVRGASESTAVYQIITHHLTSWVRSTKRERRRMERHRQRLGLRPENAAHHALFVTDDRGDMELDVRDTISALLPQERRVCELLMTGVSVRVIAKKLDLSWHGVAAIIKRIRAKFLKMELDAWLQN